MVTRLALDQKIPGPNPGSPAIEKENMHPTPRILLVIAQSGYRDEEYEDPKTVFEGHGFKVITASERKGECVGKLGGRAHADVAINEVNPHDYNAIVFVGGPGCAHLLHNNEVLFLAKEAYQHGKVVAAICMAPSILANAGLLEQKRATAFSGEKENLESKGATFTGNKVEIDGQLITATGPEAAYDFSEAISKAIVENK